MSEIISFVLDFFHKEALVWLKVLLSSDPAKVPPNFLTIKVFSGLFRQILALAFCWAALNYLCVQVDWKTVKEASEALKYFLST
jgi:hypothetical protein